MEHVVPLQKPSILISLLTTTTHWVCHIVFPNSCIKQRHFDTDQFDDVFCDTFVFYFLVLRVMLDDETAHSQGQLTTGTNVHQNMGYDAVILLQ